MLSGVDIQSWSDPDGTCFSIGRRFRIIYSFPAVLSGLHSSFPVSPAWGDVPNPPLPSLQPEKVCFDATLPPLLFQAAAPGVGGATWRTPGRRIALRLLQPVVGTVHPLLHGEMSMPLLWVSRSEGNCCLRRCIISGNGLVAGWLLETLSVAVATRPSSWSPGTWNPPK